MDYEIYDQVLAYTLETGDRILLDGNVYTVNGYFYAADDSDTLFLTLSDEWGEEAEFPVTYSDIIPLVETDYSA